MGKLKEFFLEKEEEKKLDPVRVIPNLGQVECPTCGGHDIMVGVNGKSICLECNMLDETKLFIKKQ